jgi:phosphate transport system protein
MNSFIEVKKMTLRNQFDSNLKELKATLLRMSGLVERVLDDAIKSLKSGDQELANKVIADDEEINALEHQIENEAIHLLATQQPVAKDLRRLISAIKIASELERMGDLSVDIAKITIRLHGQKLIKPLVDIPMMAEMAQQMVRNSIDSYVNEDVEKAQDLGELDNRVDEMFGKVVKELHFLGAKDVTAIDQTTSLSFVARYIERIGDHATNIGESVIYMVTGKKPDLNH